MGATPSEATLCAIWSELLQREVTPDDDVRRLGANSFDALRVATSATAAFGVDVVAGDVLGAPSIRELAEELELQLIEVARADRGGHESPPASEPDDPRLRLSPRAREAARTLSRPARADLSRRLERLDPQAGTTILAARRTVDEQVPVSWSQQRAWRRWRARPDDPAANVTQAVRIRDPFRAAALYTALRELAARQELLRARLSELSDGVVLQHFEARSPACVRVVDLGNLDAASAEATLRELAASEARRPFLPNAELWRATLLMLGPRDHALLLTLHDTIGDPWSMDALGIHLVELYSAHSTGEPARMDWQAIQYADWARWQRDWLASGAGAPHREYWRTRLSGLAGLGLADRALGPRGTGVQVTALDGDAAARLHAFLDEADATFYMVLVAAVASALAAVTGRKIVAVGCPTAGRARSELDGLIGPFLNPLVLTVDLSDDPDFPELLSRVRTASLEAYAHHEVPYGALVAELAPQGADGLFDVAVVGHQPPPTHPGPSAPISIEPVSEPEPTASLPLEILSYDAGDDIELTAVHRTDCMTAAETLDLLGRVRGLLRSVT